MKPISVLAPMEDVTDTVFRQMVASIAAPDLFVTEFTNVDGICYALSDLRTRMLGSIPTAVPCAACLTSPILRRLVFSETERPIAAQIWGNDPEKFYEAAKFIKTLNFDGIDINMGCPQKDIMKCGGGGALIDNDVSVRVRVSEIINAVKSGAPGLPVSIKTRIGVKKIITEEWIGFLLGQNLNLITVHLRTVAEQSAVPAHWEEMYKIMDLTRKSKSKCKIIGNGDVKECQDGVRKCEEYGCDGFMIGRGVLTNPAAFSAERRILTIEDRLGLLKKHIDLWQRTWGNKKDFQILKKFVKAYINGFEGAVKMRMKLMDTSSIEELKNDLSDLTIV